MVYPDGAAEMFPFAALVAARYNVHLAPQDGDRLPALGMVLVPVVCAAASAAAAGKFFLMHAATADHADELVHDAATVAPSLPSAMR